MPDGLQQAQKKLLKTLNKTSDEVSKKVEK